MSTLYASGRDVISQRSEGESRSVHCCAMSPSPVPTTLSNRPLFLPTIFQELSPAQTACHCWFTRAWQSHAWRLAPSIKLPFPTSRHPPVRTLLITNHPSTTSSDCHI